MHAGWSIRAVDVITVLEAVIERRGSVGPKRSDKGPECIACALQDWLKEQEIETLHIKPGSPWEQPYIESFHDKLRDELLNREIFGSLREAQVVLEGWRCEYNEKRPHNSLGYQTPNEDAPLTAETNQWRNYRFEVSRFRDQVTCSFYSRFSQAEAVTRGPPPRRKRRSGTYTTAMPMLKSTRLPRTPRTNTFYSNKQQVIQAVLSQ